MENQMVIRAYGDLGSLIDAIRDYDFGESEKVADFRLQQILDSRVPVDDDDPDSYGTVAFTPDGLDQLASVLLRWYAVACELSLTTTCSSDTAQAEASFVRRDGTHEFIVRQCQHKFKGEQADLAYAAYRCFELLRLAKEGDMK